MNIDLNELFSVTNRSVVITGGASGIGLAVANVLTDRGANVTVLDRAGTAPRIPGLRYRSVPAYSYAATGADAEMLQRICDEEAADLFASTYYTCPITTPSALLAHDMIPEMLGAPLDDQAWREKHYAIEHAAIHLAVVPVQAILHAVVEILGVDAARVVHRARECV